MTTTRDYVSVTVRKVVKDRLDAHAQRMSADTGRRVSLTDAIEDLLNRAQEPVEGVLTEARVLDGPHVVTLEPGDVLLLPDGAAAREELLDHFEALRGREGVALVSYVSGLASPFVLRGRTTTALRPEVEEPIAPTAVESALGEALREGLRRSSDPIGHAEFVPGPESTEEHL